MLPQLKVEYFSNCILLAERDPSQGASLTELLQLLSCSQETNLIERQTHVVEMRKQVYL